jgi:hypothetical protein
VSYICCVHTTSPEPLLFEGKQAKQFVYKLAYDFYPSLSPSPNLWGYQVINGNATFFHLARHPQVEVRTIGQQRSQGRVFCRIPAKATVFAVNTGQVPDDFGKAYDGQTPRVNNRLNSGGLKSWSGATIEA